MKKFLFTTFLLLSVVTCFAPVGWSGTLDDVNAGVVAFKEGNYDEAIRLYTKAIDSGEFSRDDLGIAYLYRGIAWKNKGDYDRAIADYDKAIDINPGSAYAYNERGIAWRRRGDYDRAIADYTKAIKIDPKCAAVYNNRGNAWFKKADYDKAIADYNKAIDINPRSAPAYKGLAWLMATCPDGRYRNGKQAVEFAKKALELENLAIFLDTLAAAYAEAGRLQDAIKTQEKAIGKLKEEGNTQDIPEYKEHFAAYKAGKPWREK